MTVRKRIVWAVRAGALGVLAVCAMAPSACSSSAAAHVATADGAHTTPSAAVDGQQAALKFTACMRDKGIPMDDPDPQTGEIKPHGDAKTLPNFTDAYAACKTLLPAGQRQDGPDLTPAMLDSMRKFAQCMRDSGIGSYPDPGPRGWDTPNSIPTGPDVDAAFAKCAPIMGVNPSAGSTGVG